MLVGESGVSGHLARSRVDAMGTENAPESAKTALACDLPTTSPKSREDLANL